MRKLLNSTVIAALCAILTLTSCEKNEVQNIDASGSGKDDASLRAAATTKIQLRTHPTLGTYMTDKNGVALYFNAYDLNMTQPYLTGDPNKGFYNYYAVNNSRLRFFFETLTAADMPAGVKFADFSNVVLPGGQKATTYKGWVLHYGLVETSWPNPARLENPGEINYYPGGNGLNDGGTIFIARPDFGIMMGVILIKDADGTIWADGSKQSPEAVNALSPVFTDVDGRSLYTFKGDKKGASVQDRNFEKTSQYTICEVTNTIAPPGYMNAVTAAAPYGSPFAPLFRTIDFYGRKQLCFNGWPLYYYKGDVVNGKAVRGSTKGQSAQWRVNSPLSKFPPLI